MIYIKVSTKSIQALNNGKQDKKLSPVRTIQGDWVLNADILTDEQTWGFAFNYLHSCPQVELNENDFNTPIP